MVVGKKSESFEKSLDMADSTAERMLKRRKEKARISKTIFDLKML